MSSMTCAKVLVGVACVVSLVSLNAAPRRDQPPVVRPAAPKIEEVSIADPEAWGLCQQTPMTCWAACNRMLLSKLDLAQTEQEQVLRMTAAMPTGGLNGAGADFENAKVALGGEYKDANKKSKMVIPYVAYSQAYYNKDRQYFANAILVNSLKKGIPAIIATPRHAVIAYGATYYQEGPVTRIVSLKYIDPLCNPATPNKPTLGEVSGLQLDNLIGFMTARVEDLE